MGFAAAEESGRIRRRGHRAAPKGALLQKVTKFPSSEGGALASRGFATGSISLRSSQEVPQKAKANGRVTQQTLRGKDSGRRKPDTTQKPAHVCPRRRSRKGGKRPSSRGADRTWGPAPRRSLFQPLEGLRSADSRQGTDEPRNQDTKCIYTKHPNQGKPEKQKANWRLLGTRRGGEGRGVFCGADANASELARGDAIRRLNGR